MMIGAAKRTARRTLAGPGWRVFAGGECAVVAFHGVPDGDRFRELLEAIAREHTFITAREFRVGLESPGRLPDRPVLITFDDGERSVVENGLPVLDRLGISALLFVVGGLVDTVTPFWWDEVQALAPAGIHEVRRLKTVANDERLRSIETLRTSQEPVRQKQLTTTDLRTLVDAGWEIGNHSYDHPCLDQCSESEAISQIERCHQELLDRGIKPTAFAYPNGNLDERIEPTLERLGYDLGFLFDHRHTRRSQHPLRLSRLRLDSTASGARAALILSGAHGAIMRMRGRG